MRMKRNGTGYRKRTRKWRRRKRGFAVAKRRETTKRRLKQWRGSKSRRKRDLAGAVEERCGLHLN